MDQTLVTLALSVRTKALQQNSTITGIKEIGNDISTIMSINPMGSQIDVLEGQTHEKVKHYSVENLQTWELLNSEL